ncbi:MAG: bifunctional (p)ppGpp synthetase/guanosine-3',5'-bis(diphosphate) 3'-pyrophosphohydrolase [SAR324 cluster bacterium]|uniref:Bifunctional (P)ppGpp synthetase/guanosine-3',5'-bis(Diphosphate) 3'-pyrophosphohydrolase n=1 Tax=SAR324 cluster bacterium TaxID=2024889 RepID=A0A7X9IJ90_9DELT|nr:bifunctional (p)ppGpp synthetase/guanosine-3',5'-bis(diphosphate) 3'-pyrophosphohydrolase [SAR324 cluster bacterium]
MRYEDIAEAIKRYYPDPDLAPVKKAYEFAEHAHSGQRRVTGEPYINHLIDTALLVCQLRLDIPSVTASLLHDTIEDCVVTKEQLEAEFGKEVAHIVDGVTKLTRIEFDSREEKQAESFRKMLVAMSKDIRVVLVKLCDRLHNMRTLEHLSRERQIRIAQETKEIYAPLANRLGIFWLKSELENLCLYYLRPDIYQLIKEDFDKSAGERQGYIQEVIHQISKLLEENGISASVAGRAKHFYSIWNKMEDQGLTFDEVNDLLGFRVIVSTIRACYETLGVIHSRWKPVPGRFKDYIAMPKPNLYQSLHTTVIGPEGQRIEIQIRTPEMHKLAEEGIAAHWRYKEGGAPQAFDLKWVSELVETQQYLKNPDEFIQSVKGELFPDDVFVFTPKGDLIRLSAKSTPLDFAYAVHTDVGHHCTGARINGQIVQLNHLLENGDTVEILTSKSQVPRKDWLRFVATSKAKQRIRAFLKSEEHARAMALGMEILTRDLRKLKLNLKKLEKEGRINETAQHMGLRSEGDLFAGIGYGKILVSKVISKLVPEGTDLEGSLKEQEESPIRRIFQRAAKASKEAVGVKVSGLDDVLVRFAKCCEPLPGDRIVGFISRGRGVAVHRADCPEVLKCDPYRRIDVGWDTGAATPRKVRLTVHCQDQMGILARVTETITTHGANITRAHVKTLPNSKAVNAFELEISDARQLERLKNAIELLPGVIRVERVRQLSGKNEEED